MKKVNPHDKFISDHLSHIIEVFEDKDIVTHFDTEGDTVWACQEKKCKEEGNHAHKRRPYLVYVDE